MTQKVEVKKIWLVIKDGPNLLEPEYKLLESESKAKAYIKKSLKADKNAYERVFGDRDFKTNFDYNDDEEFYLIGEIRDVGCGRHIEGNAVSYEIIELYVKKDFVLD